jgi:hypothetical protein
MSQTRDYLSAAITAWPFPHSRNRNLFLLFPYPTYEPSRSLYTPKRGMFSSSARRVALTTSPAPIACIATAAPRAVASKALSYQSHQRRLSSSKPSSPADGPKKIAESEAVAAAPSKSKGGSGGVEKVDKTRSSKKKAKYVSANSTVKSRDQSMLHLPSVPSTQHIAPKGRFIVCRYEMHDSDTVFLQISEQRTSFPCTVPSPSQRVFRQQ